MSRIEETLDGCVQPLRRDPEIALDIRRELAGHLEEHLDAGMSEEEALRRFGDPGEIGAGLFQANFKRLKLRAKVRLAVMILAVPACLLLIHQELDAHDRIGCHQENNGQINSNVAGCHHIE